MTVSDINQANGRCLPMSWLRICCQRALLVVMAGGLALPALAPASANQAAVPPSFFNLSKAPLPAAEPRLGAAPDVVKAFGLDRSPELFSNKASTTPELPRLSGYSAAPAFPDRPYIPDLFGAEKCPERGPGFYRLRGTSSCIHVGGRVGAGVQIGGRGNSGAFTYGRIQADVVTPTEIGDLTLTMAVQGAMTTNNTGPIYVGPRNRLIP